MKCWKCGQENSFGIKHCINCGTSLERTPTTTSVGKAMRELYDRYGCKKVLTEAVYLKNGLGDFLNDSVTSRTIRNQIGMAMDAGLGQIYYEHLIKGKPDSSFTSRAKEILTRNCGFSDNTANEIVEYFDEMIGWKTPEAVKKQQAYNPVGNQKTVKSRYAEKDINRSASKESNRRKNSIVEKQSTTQTSATKPKKKNHLPAFMAFMIIGITLLVFIGSMEGKGNPEKPKAEKVEAVKSEEIASTSVVVPTKEIGVRTGYINSDRCITNLINDSINSFIQKQEVAVIPWKSIWEQSAATTVDYSSDHFTVQSQSGMGEETFRSDEFEYSYSYYDNLESFESLNKDVILWKEYKVDGNVYSLYYKSEQEQNTASIVIDHYALREVEGGGFFLCRHHLLYSCYSDDLSEFEQIKAEVIPTDSFLDEWLGGIKFNTENYDTISAVSPISNPVIVSKDKRTEIVVSIDEEDLCLTAEGYDDLIGYNKVINEDSSGLQKCAIQRLWTEKGEDGYYTYDGISVSETVSCGFYDPDGMEPDSIRIVSDPDRGFTGLENGTIKTYRIGDYTFNARCCKNNEPPELSPLGMEDLYFWTQLDDNTGFYFIVNLSNFGESKEEEMESIVRRLMDAVEIKRS